MTESETLYFNIGQDHDPEDFKNTVLTAYQEHESIRIIFDLEGKSVNMSAMKKIKKIFEEIGVEKLEETCIICKDGIKKTLIKNFLKLVKTKKPVRFI